MVKRKIQQLQSFKAWGYDEYNKIPYEKIQMKNTKVYTQKWTRCATTADIVARNILLESQVEQLTNQVNELIALLTKSKRKTKSKTTKEVH